jgi:hypothetical protein
MGRLLCLTKSDFGSTIIVIVGLVLQPDHPSKLPVLQPRFGISQPFGCAMPNLFSLGTQVDRPKQFGLLDG